LAVFFFGCLRHPAGLNQQRLSAKGTARSAVTGNACRVA